MVKVQLDNCKVHILSAEFLAIASEFNTNGLTIWSYFQPLNSPDTNVLNLGVFNAIQMIYYSNPPHNFGEIVKMVKRAYNELDPKKINQCFLSLQDCLDKILDCNGGNSYSIPHMNKAKMQKNGLLPAGIPVLAEVNNWFN